MFSVREILDTIAVGGYITSVKVFYSVYVWTFFVSSTSLHSVVRLIWFTNDYDIN